MVGRRSFLCAWRIWRPKNRVNIPGLCKLAGVSQGKNVKGRQLKRERYHELDDGERAWLRGDPVVKRVANHGSFGFPGIPQATFHRLALCHLGFFGVPPMNRLMKDHTSAAPSQTAAPACI